MYPPPNILWWFRRRRSGGAPPPAAPASLTATPASATSVDLSWPAVTDATSYTVYRLTGYSGTPSANVGTPATNSFTDTGLSAGDGYTYAVTASNAGGESAQSPTATAVPGMVARWTLDNTGAGYVDLIGGLTLAAVGTAPTTAAGIINDAASFGGAGYLEEADNSKFHAAVGYAVDFWVWFDAFSAFTMIVTKDGANRDWLFYQTPGNAISFMVRTFGGTTPEAITGALSLSTWYHILGCVIPGNTVEIYLNGVLAMSTPMGDVVVPPSSQAVGIGGRVDGVPLPLTGRIDEPAFYQLGTTFDPAALAVARYNGGAGRRP